MKCIYLFCCILFVTQITAQCPTGDITLKTQLEVNQFPTNYPGCVNMNFSMTITEIYPADITSLAPLSGIVSIGGNLTVQGNDALPNLSGLSGLTSVNGNLKVADNDLMVSFSGLNGLTTVGGEFIVDANPAMATFTGLNSINSIGGQIQILSNNVLTSINGMSSLATLNGGLKIINNPLLENISGLNNITSIGGPTFIMNNNALSSMSALNGITSINGPMLIVNNPALTSVAGLEDVINIAGGLTINANNLLTDLSGINSLGSLGGSLTITNQPNLVSISTLSTLTSVGGMIKIENDPLLINLYGLENITSGISDVQLMNNGSLVGCAVQSICTYLNIPSNPATVYSNSGDCNTRDGILGVCAELISPVELVYFHGKYVQKHVLLEWKTESEFENAYFTIEHSVDGIHFSELSRMEGQLTTNTPHLYSYVDNTPRSGKNYYRLTAIDLQGNPTYSPVRLVELPDSKMVHMYPNPCKDWIYLTAIPDDAEIQILSMDGKMMYQSATYDGPISVSTIENGLYQIVINHQGSQQHIPLHILK